MPRLAPILILCAAITGAAGEIDSLIEASWRYALPRLAAMAEDLPAYDSLPRTVTDSGDMHVTKTTAWTAGFFPGCLWYAYEYTGDASFRSRAAAYTAPLESQKNNGKTHDVGFMLFCSFGNGSRLTGDPHYAAVCEAGATTLIGRFRQTVGCIESWSWGEWDVPVIIDNMMNLELPMWAAEMVDDSLMRAKAISHADKTIENHIRPDNSTYHVVDYNQSTGEVIARQTFQGYADESTWARGQAWGIYGFTMMYRYTGLRRYLEAATSLADFFIARFPQGDPVPYWDFEAPDIPDAPRDASAAAIAASALLELAYLDSLRYGGNDYRAAATALLASLCSERYRASQVSDYFLLTHSVGNKPRDSEVDVPLIYADYYFLEALLRYRQYGPDAVKTPDERVPTAVRPATAATPRYYYDLRGRALRPMPGAGLTGCVVDPMRGVRMWGPVWSQ